MKKLLSVLSAAICALLLFSSCQATGGNAKQVLNEITSDKYEGRLIGTAGNRLAAEYLAGFLEKNKIQPYFDGTYFQSYTQTTADPNLQKPRVIIRFEDGSTQELVHGKDFITNAVSQAINAELPVVFDVSNAAGEVLPIIRKENTATLASSFTGKPIIAADDTYALTVGSPLSKLPFTITINNALRDNLIEKKAVSAGVSCEYAAVNSALSNVAGVIPAQEKTDKAMVLTAHFDFIGHQGSFKYQGATDNTSGVAALMSAAVRLQALTANAPRTFDIIIAAVNSEETNEQPGVYQGSSELVKAISAEYKDIRNINIDCVGSTGSPTLAMGAVSPESEPFAETFRSVLSAKNIPFSNESYGGGDHQSFTQKAYPAVCVGEDILSAETQHIHSILNTTNNINPEALELIAEAVAEFVMDEEADHFISIEKAFEAAGESVPFSDEWNAQVLAARDELLQGEKLKLNESIYFMFGTQLVKTGAADQKMTVEQLAEYYPDLNIPEALQDFKLMNDVRLDTPDITYIGISDGLPLNTELGTIFQTQIKGGNVRGFTTVYKSSENNIKELIIRGTKHDEPDYMLKAISGEITPLEGKHAGYMLVSAKNAEAAQKYYSIYFTSDSWEYIVHFADTYTREELEQFLAEYDLLSLAKQISFA